MGKFDTPRQRDFVLNELARLSIQGAFLRGRVYPKTLPPVPKSVDDQRTQLRKELVGLLRGYEKQYAVAVEPMNHENNIEAIKSTLNTKFRGCLLNQEFRIGTAQKALNLYLKYLWCLGEVALPPHCPFDAIVIAELNFPRGTTRPVWTKINSIEEYRKLVEAAKAKAGEKSLAQWEMELWGNKSTP